jgi:hypothetical protein
MHAFWRQSLRSRDSKDNRVSAVVQVSKKPRILRTLAQVEEEGAARSAKATAGKMGQQRGPDSSGSGPLFNSFRGGFGLGYAGRQRSWSGLLSRSVTLRARMSRPIVSMIADYVYAAIKLRSLATS